MSIKKSRRARVNRHPQWWTMILVTAALVSGGVANFASAAWQNPTCDPNVNPDTCNAAAPINVSGAAQTKNGPLTVTVNTGINALTVNSGPTGSPVALAINSSGGGFGLDIANSATSGALNINSSGATSAATINQNFSGGTGLKLNVGGTLGGTGIDAGATSGNTGVGLRGSGSANGVVGVGFGNGAGVEGTGAGSGNGVEGFIGAGGTGAAGYFDGTNSNYALKTLNGKATMTSAIASTPTLDVTSTLGGATGPSAITAQNDGTNSPAIYGVGKNSYGISGSTQSFNFAGVIGCYGGSTNCGLLGSGNYAGYFNGPALVEQTLRVNSMSTADVVMELQVQGQYSGNSYGQFSVPSSTGPHAMESTGDYLFVCNRTAPYEVHKVRPSDGRIVGVFPLPPGFQCTDIIFDGSYIWISSDGVTTGVVRVEPHTGVVNFFPIASQIRGLAFDGGYIWATGYSTDQLFQINTGTGAIVATYGTLGGGGPSGVIHVNGVLFWVNVNLIAGQYYLTKMNTDGSGAFSYPITAEAPRWLVYDGDAIWIPSSNASNRLIRFDLASAAEKQVYVLPDTVLDIAFDQNFLWLSAPATRRLLVIRPIDGKTMANIGALSPSGLGTIERLFFDGHAVWYSMSTDNLIGRYTVPWHDGYANGSVFGGISLYENATGTYTCMQADGAGGIATSLGVCP